MKQRIASLAAFVLAGDDSTAEETLPEQVRAALERGTGYIRSMATPRAHSGFCWLSLRRIRERDISGKGTGQLPQIRGIWKVEGTGHPCRLG
jgi:hypothetical protein